ncbi:hypothetical protein Mgra_00003397 [Meloidogyne graminicola]|uniref:Uncharacterized protein n=1 Tax=Meloidogyne graminicola TaxID=189291 RepID=A0A8S9ZW83_9BILA|nr:hypothetical protein Mgra_00003397 [Meloidogyne graminicola]
MLKFNSIRFVSSLRQFGKFASANEVLEQRGDVLNLSELSNGLRVASNLNNRLTTTIGVWIAGGSQLETNENNGVASVFENLVHTGSIKRNPMELQKDLSKLGASLFSYTSREHSSFFVECFPNDVEKVVEILADVLLNTNIEPAKLEEQRANALKRLDSYEDANRQGVVMDYLHLTAFQGTPMAHSPLGNSKALENMDNQTVKNFMEDLCKPCRMVLTCAGGGFNHDTLHRIAEKHFGHLTNSYDRKIPSGFLPSSRVGFEFIPQQAVRFTGSEFLYRDDSYPFIYGALAVEGVHRGHIDYLPLEIAKTYFGQWDRTYAASLNAPSMIIQKVAAEEEMMGFESFNLSYNNTGLFGFYFVLTGELIDTCCSAINPLMHAFRHLATGITVEETERAKNALKTNLFSNLETNTQMANYIASQVLSTGKIIPLSELERKISFISSDTIQSVMMDHVYDREIACAGTGKVEAWPIYQEMRSQMSWWRL